MFCKQCHRQLPDNYRFCPWDGARTSDKPDVSGVPVSTTRITDALLGRRYTIRGFIGKGAIARVYLAHDEETGNPVAVKVMEKPLRNDEQARKRFLREARAVTKIGHPSIVRVLESGIRDDDGAPYLVMEYLFGEPVGRYMAREGVVMRDIALPALRQAASALAAAHDVKVIHRDVKPDNLYFIGEPGDPYELKVLDFGFSKIQTSKMTAAGIVLGTPAFMAPEQALAEEVDARTDVYALGMVMYRMLTGRPAFDAADDIAALAHQILTPLPRPSQVAPDIDRRTEKVILMATHKDPRNRYPSMHSFFDDLGRLADTKLGVWAEPIAGDRYHPASKAGELLVEALKRNL